MPRRVVKVAVVGSGLAGLTAAYLLSRTEPTEDVDIEVHLFEKEPSLGMDSSSVSLEVPDQKGEWRIDVPMRSFQGGYYPCLISLYKHLGVKFRRADFSYSFSLLTRRGTPLMTTTTVYNGSSGRGGIGMPSILHGLYLETKDRPWPVRLAARLFTFGLFAFMALQLAFCYLRLLWLALPVMRQRHVQTMSFRDWVADTTPSGAVARFVGADRGWEAFIEDILIPLFSAICTAPEDDVMDHPVEEFLDYVWLTLGTHHMVVERGVRDVVPRLTAKLPSCRIHLSSPLTTVRRSATANQLTIECGSTFYNGFSHIVFATQARSAVPLLASYLSSLPCGSSQRPVVEELVRCLGTFQYRTTIVINHTDETLLPVDVRDRRDLNLVCGLFGGLVKTVVCNEKEVEVAVDQVEEKDENDMFKSCVPPTYTMATHILPRPASFPANFPPVYQTTNPIIPPRLDAVLSIARIDRAVLTLESKDALKGLYWPRPRRVTGETELGPLQGVGAGKDTPGIWVCGSFAHSGIPLLEGCVVSARNVVRGLLEAEGVEARGTAWTW